MSPAATLSIIITSLIILYTSLAIVSGDKTAYDALQDYDFPPGLLPKGVTNYELDERTGRFKVFLEVSSCSFSIKGYHLKYKSTIGGVISNDRIKDLKGISVKVLRMWVKIGEIGRRQDRLYFSAAGIASADFTVKTFAKSPQCGCGFNCGGKIVKSGNVNLNRSVSTFFMR